MKYIDNNITFNDVKDIAKTADINSSNRYAGSEYDYNSEDNPVAPKFLINAIDIDWNNGNIDEVVGQLTRSESEITEGIPVENINTTGDLLYTIANLQAQVTVLTNLVKGLYKALSTTSNS